MVPLKMRPPAIDERPDFYNVASQRVSAADAIALEIVAGPMMATNIASPSPRIAGPVRGAQKSDPGWNRHATMCMASLMAEPYSTADHECFHATNSRRCLGKVQKLVVCHAHQF